MYNELVINELEQVNGGVNGLKVTGGTLLVVAGVGECMTGVFTWGGIATIAGGVGCIIDGLDE